jgi:hypothetical protein
MNMYYATRSEKCVNYALKKLFGRARRREILKK